MYDLYSDVCRIRHYESDQIIDIGVLDSVYSLSDETVEENNLNIGRTVDCLYSAEDMIGEDIVDAHWHGQMVAEIIDSMAGNIRLNFFRVIRPEAGVPAHQRAVMKGLDLAKQYGMDVINLSLGNDHTDDGSLNCIDGSHPCKVRELIEKHLEDDVVIVAAAGNKGQNERLVCPGRSNRVVTVGGLKILCEADISSKTLEPSLSPDFERRPPQAAWFEREGELTDILCSGHGCSPIHRCEENRNIVESEFNFEPVNGKPDVLAPGMIFHVDTHDSANVYTGSSYSVPIVTAVAGEIVSGLLDCGENVDPEVIKDAIRSTALPLSDGREMMVNGEDAFVSILQNYGYKVDLTMNQRDIDMYWEDL